ncbi:unnamed protein product [Cuscuta epithymum]|uniref:DUF4378 domain-containing protein n=1 Tax=Cuscuta epithymum TaxID=186058 RepID=A0AAV0CBU9_9ASTE|nr:unnamed protein product [Cuscuta epithymum]
MDDNRRIGCMPGFFQLFYRHHILAGKRLHTTKLLTPFTEVDDSTSEPENTTPPPETWKGSAEGYPSKVVAVPPSPTKRSRESPSSSFSSVITPLISPRTLPIFEVKDGARPSWKIHKEAPRLSLDSRATVDSKGSLQPKELQQPSSYISASHSGIAKDKVFTSDDDVKARRHPSVIAKLMGLEALPQSVSETAHGAELRRSASESRVSTRDLFNCHTIDGNDFELKGTNHLNSHMPNCVVVDNVEIDNRKPMSRALSSTSWSPPQYRKSFYDRLDVFPDPKQTAPLHVDIDKRLDGPSKDLETLKQILESLQLKGLLRAKKPSGRIDQLNVIYDDPRFSFEESQIVVMKPSRSISSINRKDIKSSDGSLRCPNSVISPRGLNVDPQQREREPIQNQKFFPLQSHKGISRSISEKNIIKQSGAKNPWEHVHQEDEITTLAAEERLNREENNEGRSLLKRCDKLIQSIAEMTATDLQPSPVSVLDSSFYKDESPSPSPTRKRRIGFLGDFSKEISTTEISPVQLKSDDAAFDSDFSYIADIVKASHYLPKGSDIFLLLEKQHFFKREDTSKNCRLQRRLIFGTTTEILNRSEKQLPPWKVYSWPNCIYANSSTEKVLSEFQRIQERGSSDDLFEIICTALKKDLAQDGVNGWADCPVEMSEAVLDIERLVYKDLMGEAIRDLASFAPPRRKLVF